MKDDLGLSNVTFLPPVDKKEMPGILKEVDVALVPLKKARYFQRCDPVKDLRSIGHEESIATGC
jgi:hypothetical protein